MARTTLFPAQTSPPGFGASAVFSGAANGSSYISLGTGTVGLNTGSVAVWLNSDTDWASLAAIKTIFAFGWYDGFTTLVWDNALAALSLETWTGAYGLTDHAAYLSTYESVFCGAWPKAGAWSHLVVTWNGATNTPMNVNLYLDGNGLLFGSNGNNTAGTVWDMLIGGVNGTIGTHESWDGYMDEFAVYSRVLTGTEIKGLYNHATYPASGLVARFNFDEASGAALDVSGNGKDGTLHSVTRSTTVVLAPGY